MRRAPPLLLLLLVAAAAAQPPQVLTDQSIDTLISNDTIVVDNENGTLVLRDVNGTVIELDGNPEEVVRKKRTFGDIVFRGLADVLGYSVARKPPQAAFPPPLAPVPGIDTPLAAPAPPAPAPAPATAPCGQPRAAGPPPCRAQKPPPPPPPPQPKAVPPCPRPRAAPRPRPKPTPPPPPPPPPPCAQPRANPTTPAPCAPPPPPPPPPKQADNLERITSNLRLNFNFNRSPITPATPAPPAAEAIAQDDAQAEFDSQEQFVPIAIEPRAAKLPQTEPRQPRVYVDAFVVRNGVARRVDAVDAKQFNAQRANAEDDYLAYDDDNAQQQLDDDDYEDVQESRDREAAVQQFGNAVDQFWQNKRQQRKPVQQKARRLPANHYQNVHFGDRDLADDIRQRDESQSHQSIQRERARPNRIPLPLPEAEDDSESTTTTEDPRTPLKPRVLPPTEHNPNQIDTVTVRVPPIYREKRPRKLHRERPEQPDRDEEHDESREFSSREREYEHDTDGDDSSLAPRTEQPAKRKRRRKQRRKTRAADNEYYSAGDFDYYGNKVPVSKEEKFYMDLTVPPPTLDADVARHETPVDSGYFLEDHERLREDPSQRIRDDDRDGESERADDSERIDDRERSEEAEGSLEDKERLVEDNERAGEEERAGEDERAGEEDRADERERTDKLSPNARVRETGYRSNYVRATNVQVEDPRPPRAALNRKQASIGQP